MEAFAVFALGFWLRWPQIFFGIVEARVGVDNDGGISLLDSTRGCLSNIQYLKRAAEDIVAATLTDDLRDARCVILGSRYWSSL